MIQIHAPGKLVLCRIVNAESVLIGIPHTGAEISKSVLLFRLGYGMMKPGPKGCKYRYAAQLRIGPNQGEMKQKG